MGTEFSFTPSFRPSSAAPKSLGDPLLKSGQRACPAVAAVRHPAAFRHVPWRVLLGHPGGNAPKVVIRSSDRGGRYAVVLIRERPSACTNHSAASAVWYNPTMSPSGNMFGISPSRT